jgi:hypothetical protein
VDGTAIAQDPIELELPDGTLDPLRSESCLGRVTPLTPRDAYDPAGRWATDHARVMRQAMAYGTALASLSVEGFGTERSREVTGAEVSRRV